jgi:type II secretory ATPase GspE/PulE/Tfp pilus assembly ATPase PilB-like protein
MALQVLPQIHANSTKAFVELLVKKGLIKPGFIQILSSKYLDEADTYLLSHHLVEETQLAQAYSEYYALALVSLVNRPIKPQTARLIPESVARKYTTVVYDLDGLDMHVAVGDPAKLQRNAPEVLVRLRQQKGLRVHLAIASRQEVQAVIDKLYAPAPIVGNKPTSARDSIPAPIVGSKPTSARDSIPAPIAAPKPQVHQDAAPPPNQPPKQEPLPPKPPERRESAPPAAPIAASPLAAEPAVPPKKEPAPTETPPALVKNLEERPKNIDLIGKDISQPILNKIPSNVARKYRIIVFDAVAPKSKYESPLIKVAAVDPNDVKVREILGYIEQRNKVIVDRYHTSAASFEAAIKLYPDVKEAAAEIVDEKDDAPSPASTSTVPTPVPAADKEPLTMKLPGETEAPKKVEPAAKETKLPVQGPKDSSELQLNAEDIMSRPSEEASTQELKQLAKEQEVSLENQNLDRLLKEPVLTVEDLAKVFKGAKIPEIVAATLFLAIRRKASDVHIEAAMETVRVRFRVDGILHDVIRVPHFLHAPLISRIKILSKMKIDEQRVPQDGRFDVIIDNRQVDLRVSTLPTVHGEKIVMRLLDKSEGVLSLEQLGVTGTNFDRLVDNINKPYGIILSTGPTGSGKSTTLYAILNRISKPGVNIITLEDPVEYELPGINQAQVKPGIGFTFAEGLRSVLRQDPNVIMVGEIRDLETAAMATHAALTGHLVLSTLHTNDSAGALPRLINMGVEPFLITSSINAVIGQRLVRKVCDSCKRKADIPPAVLSHIKKELEALPSGKLKNINLESMTFYKGGGCDKCVDGYRGRIGIYEVLVMDEKVEALAVSKAPSSEIKKSAIASGMITMSQDGLIKSLKGITTIDEVLRVTTTQMKELPV